MQSFDNLVGWQLHSYQWLCEDDFQITFESSTDLSLDAWVVTFKNAIAACVLGPWGVLKRSSVSVASGGLLDGVLNFDSNELNDYKQFLLWYDSVGPPGAIVIAESLEFRDCKLKRGGEC